MVAHPSTTQEDAVSDTDLGTISLDEIHVDDLLAEFHPCEEGDNFDELQGVFAFGTTSRHVLATWLPAAFDKWGVKYKRVEGWADRGRPITAGYFDPNGSLTHHTGSTSSPTNPNPSLSTLINGRSDLRGPLCQIATDYNGLIYIIAAGRANHAGAARAAMGNPSGDGNAMYIGNEVMTNGTQKMPQAQYDAVVLAAAAIADHFNQTSATKVGLHHTTSTTGKWDLGAGTGKSGVPYDVTKFRADVTARLKAGPPKPPAPAPITTQKEPSMVLVRIKDTKPVYVSTGIERRWVQNSTDFLGLQRAIRAEGGKGVVTEISVDELEGFGPLVGPDPLATVTV
jgi:N-acetylmuramoyl-L-alanine amidase